MYQHSQCDIARVFRRKRRRERNFFPITNFVEPFFPENFAPSIMGPNVPLSIIFKKQFVNQSACDQVIRMVELRFSVEREMLKKRSRGNAGVARARQICMYLLHTSLSLPYSEVADLFDRERSTIVHACRLVEDWRDNREFDETLCVLEDLLSPLHRLTQLANEDWQ